MLAGDLSSWPRDAVQEHRAVLDAIATGDQEAAEANARLHIRLVNRRLQARLGHEDAAE